MGKEWYIENDEAKKEMIYLIGGFPSVETVEAFTIEHREIKVKEQNLLGLTYKEYRLELEGRIFKLFYNGNGLIECDVTSSSGEKLFSYRSYFEREKELEKTYLFIMDQTGDSKLELSWDPKNNDEEKEVEETFKDLQEKGFMIFECKTFLGVFKRKGKEIKEYDSSKRHWIAQMSELRKIGIKEVIEDGEELNNEVDSLFDAFKSKPKPNKKYIATQPIMGG